MEILEKHILKHTILILMGIVLLAVCLRFFALGSNPVSLNWDEAAWGYNAYTLGLDAKDEFGVLLPYAYIESFGDFKPPLYAYVSIIPVKLFGLTEFSIRFASAFFGSLTVLVSFYLVRRIFDTAKFKNEYALITAFLLAISPWHIMLSRAAFEANLVTFFLVVGVWLFLKGIQDKGIYIVLAVIPFVLSLYTFNTARIVTPLLVGVLAFSSLRILFTQKRKEVILACLLGVILILPIVPFLLSDQAALRFKEVNIFTDISIIERSNRDIQHDNNALWSKLLHHRYPAFAASFLDHYLDHFDPKFLFVTGDGNPKFSTQDVGQLYLFEIPFFVSGIIILLRRRENYWWFIPVWLLIGIIPAATARETPHALRIESTLPMFQLLSAIGVVWFLVFLKKYIPRFQLLGIVLISLMFIGSVVYFLHGYYTHYPREFSGEWQYGYKESVEYAISQKDIFDEIHITESLGRPYIYYLLYSKADPDLFRKTAQIHRDAFGFVHVQSFDKFHFYQQVKPINTTKKTLYITIPSEVPQGAVIKKEFHLLDGKTQLIAFTM